MSDSTTCQCDEVIKLLRDEIKRLERCIELTQALEQQRALHITSAVASLRVGGADAMMPTPFQAGYQAACEEIEHRLRTEQWELGGVAVPLPMKGPDNAQ